MFILPRRTRNICWPRVSCDVLYYFVLSFFHKFSLTQVVPCLISVIYLSSLIILTIYDRFYSRYLQLEILSNLLTQISISPLLFFPSCYPTYILSFSRLLSVFASMIRFVIHANVPSRLLLDYYSMLIWLYQPHTQQHVANFML